MLGDIDQFDQQAMLDKRHQQRLGHFAQVTAQGAEQLAFRWHLRVPAKEGRDHYSRSAIGASRAPPLKPANDIEVLMHINGQMA
ncbi:hypothetical protein D3C84_1008810 [compost metagenome]